MSYVTERAFVAGRSQEGYGLNMLKSWCSLFFLCAFHPFALVNVTKCIPASPGIRRSPHIALFCSSWPCLQACLPKGKDSKHKAAYLFSLPFSACIPRAVLCVSPPVLIWAEGNKTIQAQSSFVPSQLSPVLGLKHTLQAWQALSPLPSSPALAPFPGEEAYLSLGR